MATAAQTPERDAPPVIGGWMVAPREPDPRLRLAGFLLGELADRERCRFFEFAWRRLEATAGTLRIRDLAGELGWSEKRQIALRCGYHDQAHLVKEFRAFSGSSPTELLGRMLPARSLPEAD